ncbi:MAG: hypothetical protein WDN69_10875 [Aliidongia sp.]
MNTTQLVAESLNVIGINARVATPDPAAWTQKLISGNYDMAINSYLTGETPYRSFDTAFHSRFAGKTRFAATRFVRSRSGFRRSTPSSRPSTRRSSARTWTRSR